MNLVEFPSAHSRIEHLDSAGFPVVTIILPGGELWQTWADYRQRFKIGAQRTHARHVGSLIEFLAAKAHEFHHLEARGRLIQAWADALVMGTVGEDGNDPSGLFWLPMSYSEARKTVQSVTAFGDFLAERGIAPPLNPERVATVAEQIVFWRAWSFKKGASLLGHLRSAVDSRGRSYVAREVSIRKTAHHGGADDLKRFPNDLIVSLLKDGFSARPPHLRWTVWRDQMITLLMHYGGRRVSEPLHMWVGDVEPNSTDPTRCIPWIHHPSEGYIEHVDPRTGTAKRLRRDVYLRLVHGIRPLNLRTAPETGWIQTTDADHRYEAARILVRCRSGSAFLATLQLLPRGASAGIETSVPLHHPRRRSNDPRGLYEGPRSGSSADRLGTCKASRHDPAWTPP